MRRIDRRAVLAFALAAAMAPWRAAGADGHEAALWSALRSGEAIAMMRHALAPGTGDPASFMIGDCSTQRNLSEEGRAQARAIGERFRANGILRAVVRSSQWCRCVETAELLGLGPVEPMPALNSFFRNRAQGPAQTEALRAYLRTRGDARPLVLVTHQVNITALTRVFPASGEIVVVRVGETGQVEVDGTLQTEVG